MRKVIYYLLLLTLCSCKAELRELCYDHNHWNDVSITFDWKDAPAAQPKVLIPNDTSGTECTIGNKYALTPAAVSTFAVSSANTREKFLVS